MAERLSGEELAALVKRVFRPGPTERSLTILVDLPDAAVPDKPRWKERREMAAHWAHALGAMKSSTGMDALLVLYRNVRMNNADLPAQAWVHSGGPLPDHADALEPSAARSLPDLLKAHPIHIAVTEFSATAPLKLGAKSAGYRAATMPGFTAEMIPSLRLDYTEINRRVNLLKDLLDKATRADFMFAVDERREYALSLDLRYRTGHASGGLIPEPGTAGNLPSGEAYIVPYEGERSGDPSQSCGDLPVQLGTDVVVYKIEGNVAAGVEEDSATAREEAARLKAEPAYGNMAELGLGVLDEFGVQPSGEVLLDEKLGLHIAFGRSDHFGGQVGAKRFSRPEAVVHIDRVYVPSLQPRIMVRSVDLRFEDQPPLALMREGRYVIDFGKSS